MIMKRFFIVLGLILLVGIFSCTSTNNKSTGENSNLVYKTITVDCNWTDKIVIDTLFSDSSKFTLKTECIEEISYTDTVETGKDTLLIRNMKDMRYVINSTKFGQIFLTKASLGDSLAIDLRESGFLTPPFQIDFNTKDFSVILKLFIGFPESDSGDVYIIEITQNGKIKVIGREVSNLGEGDGV